MFTELYNLMAEIILLMATGFVLRKGNIITPDGKKCLTDLILYAILPCNIIKAFSNRMEGNFLLTFGEILLAAIVVQLISLCIARFGYRMMPEGEREVYQYATVCSNSGFLGLPMAEGIFGETGVLYASVFLIPMRIVMWTAGVSYFQKQAGNKRDVYRKVATHPCMVATYLGLVIMLAQISLPGPIDTTVRAISNCCTPMTMIYVGTILVDVPFRQLFNLRQAYYTVIRLFLIPLVVFGGTHLAHMDPLAAGVCTLLSAMPAGSTTPLLASKYGADERSAAKAVVLTTSLSAVTLPLWGMFLLQF